MQPDKPSPEPGTAEQEPAGGSPVPVRSRSRANRVAFTSAAAGLLAVAVIAAGTALASAGDHRSGHVTGRHQPAVPAAAKHLPGPVAKQLRQMKRAAAQQAAQPAHATPPKPYGTVIDTGIKNKLGELVFYAVHLHMSQLPGDMFGVMGGYLNGGHLSAATEANEVTGSDVAPGFHAVEAPIGSDAGPTPEFGYYAGPAAKITGTVGGRTIQASLAHWSVNPKVVIFWFSPTDDPQGQDVTSLAAFDAQGKPLPPGNSGVGHG